MIGRPLPLLLSVLALALAGCETEELIDHPAKQANPTAADRLAELGQIAAAANAEISVEGVMGDSRFSADYAPQEATLVYELRSGAATERFVVSPTEAIFSTSGKPDRKINRESVMLNGKDWPYASRMAAPFLDAIDGYSATIHSFLIEASNPPAEVQGGADLSWFSLIPNRDQIHDLMLLEFSKVSELKLGVDPETGLLKSLFTRPSNPDHPPAEIRSE